MTKNMLNYLTIPEFDKDFKKLTKRFRTLPNDFEIMKRASIEALYIHKIVSNAIVPIEGCCGENYTANKVRKFSCMSLKGKGAASGIRVIFVWEEEKQLISFIEIYYKGDQENENRERLKEFIKRNGLDD